MPVINLGSITPIELVPGYPARLIHSENMTLSFLEVKAGNTLPEHAHFHEQISMVMEGTFQLTIDGEPIRVGPGNIVVIPPNAKHSGLAITDCKLMDVFSPVREDYRALGEK